MSRGYWLNEDSRTFLKRGYLQPGQSPEQRISEIAHYAAEILQRPEFAPKFEEYMLNGWISLASPIWSNFGADRGLPISCNNSFFEDDMESILLKQSEIGMQTKYGAGTSAYLGEIRGEGSPIRDGGVARGPAHFAELLESIINIVSQGNIRRGACAVYLPVEHPDIEQFLEMREDGNPVQRLSLGVTIKDQWLHEMLAGDKDKRRVWLRILRKRFESGYPYIFFHDNFNNSAPDVYKDKGRTIWSSNLCTEIALSSSADESFVCCLSSLNLLHYDEWKNTDVVEVLVWLLDAVMTDYINKTKTKVLMQTARNFALRQRAIGIGTLGWHSYLQERELAFGSLSAKLISDNIHRDISEKALRASQDMVQVHGFAEPPMLQGYGRRHVTLMAVAPTTSSSFILGQVSPSVEPLDSNYFVKDLQKGVFTYRNPKLHRVLEERGMNNQATWESILHRGGSVQHLNSLDDEVKDVFKTFGEISQHDIVIQAAGRQRYIDQAQSLNLKIHSKTPVKEVSDLILEGWRLGIKSFYYQKGVNGAQELARSIMTCSACEA